MIPVYICEDNTAQREKLETLIKKHIIIEDFDMFIAKSTHDPASVLQAVQENKTLGIYFLDIDLNDPNLNGFTLAQEVRKIDSDGYIIFITTHSEMAFQTFHYKVSALEYILKDNPADIERAIKACFETIKTQLNTTRTTKKIFNIISEEKLLFIDEQKITFFEVVSPHKLIVHSLDKRIHFNGDLKEIEKRLSQNFIRCHRSFIVNLNYIDYVDKKNSVIILKNGSTCYLARRKLKVILERLAAIKSL